MCIDGCIIMVTLINLFAFVSSPKVVCLEASGPKGTMSFSFSRQVRRCARLERKQKIIISLWQARMPQFHG